MKEAYNNLKEKLHRWNYAYYVLDNPEVEDPVYDAAMYELLKIEKKYPELITEDSPSQKVGSNLVSSYKEKLRILLSKQIEEILHALEGYKCHSLTRNQLHYLKDCLEKLHKEYLGEN